MKIYLIYELHLLVFLSILIKYVSANKGIFGYEEFSTFEWQRTPTDKVSECVTWEIESSGNNITDHFLSVTINPGCTKGLSFTDTSDVGFFAAFQYYSALEIDLLVSEGKLDIRLEEPDSDIFTVIESLDASEFTLEEIQTYNFTFFNIPFPEEQEGEFSIINFSNPDPEKSVKFYMRQARLIYITPRPILDNLRLYGNDWSYFIINSTFINNIMYKHLKPYGCISIDISNPYFGPWASVRFDVKAPIDIVLMVNVERETISDLNTFINPFLDGIFINEDEWTTLEVEFKNYIYDKIYDRLDICSYKEENSWIKVRNIYFEPTYKFESSSKDLQTCCTFNQCICTVQHKKVYVRRNATISDPDLNKQNESKKSIPFPCIIPLIIIILLLQLLYN